MSRLIKKIIKEHEDNYNVQGGSITEVSTVVIDGHEVEAWNPIIRDPIHGEISSDPETPSHTAPIYDIDNGTSGGSGGDSVRDYNYDESGYEYKDVPITVKRLRSEVITNYSTEKLQEYQDAGGIPYAIMKDGSKVQVQWSDVRYVKTLPSAAPGINIAQIAAAHNQNFWTNDEGAHVTSDLKDSWVEEYAEPDHGTLAAPTLQNPWHNILLNSMGILLRKGLINLAAMESGSISFYDGSGNDSTNINAVFGSQGAQIGKETEMHIVLDSSGLAAYDSNGDLAPVHSSNITADYAEIRELKNTYADIFEAYITYLDAGEIEATNINAMQASVERFKAGTATVGDLTAMSGFIDMLVSHRVTSDYIEANYAEIGDLDAVSGKFDNVRTIILAALQADIDSLTADEIDAIDITAVNAAIDNLETDQLSANDLTALRGVIEILASHRITTDILEANYAQINLANVNNAWIANGVIKQGAIGDAQIVGVSANKLTAGEINADEIIVRNLRAENLKVGRLNGQPVIGGYSVVSTSSTGYAQKNPTTEGWYEYVNGAYVLSQDTSVRQGVVYYTQDTQVALYDQTTIDGMFDNVDRRIDSQIQTHTGSVVPTLSNSPASSWNTNALKDEHIGDIYYVINAGNQADGYTYRFAYDNTTSSYKWILIKDNQVTAALQDLIDVKGDISDLQEFQSDTAIWINDTDEGLETIRQNHTTLVTNVNNGLASKVDTTTFNTLSNTVNENSSTITTLSTKVDNIQIGGRNLLLYTGTLKKDVDPNGVSSYGYPESLVETENGIRLNSTGQRQESIQIPLATHGSVKNGEKVVLSFEARGTLTYPGRFYWIQERDANPYINNWIKDTKWLNGSGSFSLNETEWTKFVIDVTHDSSNDGTCRAILMFYALENQGQEGKWVEIKKKSLKLEKGTRATDWTPAPEEMASDESVTTVTNLVNQVKQTADTNSAKLTSFTKTVNGLDTRLSTAETSITQHTNDISLRATKTEMNSAINGVQIGGRNLLLNSDDPLVRSTYYKPTNYGSAFFYISNYGHIIAGKVYTITIEGINDGRTGLCPFIGGGSVALGGWKNITDVASVKESWTFTASQAMANANQYVIIYASSSGLGGQSGEVSGSFTCTHVKLEQGNKATDWTPAPEDMQTVAQSQAELQVTNTAINAKVSKTDYTGATVASMINQSADSVKIQAKHVEIDGTAIFNNTNFQSLLNNKFESDGVSGRNLLLGTALYDSTAFDSLSGSNIETENGILTHKDNGSSTGNRLNRIAVNPGETYTFSFEIKSNFSVSFGANDTDLFVIDISSGETYSRVTSWWLCSKQPYTTSTSWSRIVYTFTIPSNNSITSLYIGLRNTKYTEGYIYQLRRTKIEKGSKATYWTPAPEDIIASAPKAKSLKRSQRIYYRSNSSTKPAKPASWVAEASSNVYNAWSTKVAPIAANKEANATKYLYLYTCEQRETVSGGYSCTSVQLDENTTIIDGGNIITNSVDANKLNATSINASNILTVGAFGTELQNQTLNSNLVVGGRNLLVNSSNGNGWGYSTFDPEEIVYTRSTTSTGESYIATLCESYVESGVQYTLSCYAKSNGYVQDMDMHKYNNSTQHIQTNGHVQLTTDYKFYTWTFTANVTEKIKIRFDNNGSTQQGTEAILYIKKPKLEKGNKATDWTPAPEDMATKASVDGIVIGGRNLLLATGAMKKVGAPSNRVPSGGISTWASASNNCLEETSTGLKLTGANQGTECFCIALSEAGIIKNNDEVTLSFTARGNLPFVGTLYWINQTSGQSSYLNSWLNGSSSISLNTNTWTDFSTTFKVLDNNSSDIVTLLIFYNLGSSNNGKWIEIKKKSLKLELGNKATSWTPAPEEIESKALNRSQRIYYRSNSSTKPAKPASWVAEASSNVYNAWSTKVSPIAANKEANATKYLYLYTCEQRETVSGSYTCTTVQLDENTTVIDGGNIITNSIDANKINATSINASNILTVGAFGTELQNQTLNSNIQIGGRNLLLNSDDPVLYSTYRNPTSYGSASFGISNYSHIIAGKVYTITIEGINDGRTGLCPFIGGSSIAIGEWKNITNVASVKESWTFTASQAMANANQYVIIYASSSGPGAQGSVAISGSFTCTHVKLEQGNKATSWTPAPEDMATKASVDGIEIGGTNLIRNTLSFSNYSCSSASFDYGYSDAKGGSNAIKITPSSTGWWFGTPAGNIFNKIGEEYVVSVYLKAESNTTCYLNGRDIKSSSYTYNNGATRQLYNITTEWQRFYISGSCISLASASGTNIWIGQSTTVPIYTCYWKVEKGNKPTDWSPAPEDVDTGISNAAKTATNYITQVDNNGIKVHAVNNATSNYSLINASGMTVYKGGSQVAQFGDTILLGSTSGQGARVNSDGLQIFKGGSQIASFGTNVTIGKNNDTKLMINSNELYFTDTKGNKAFSIAQSQTNSNYGSAWVEYFIGDGSTKKFNLKYTASITNNAQYYTITFFDPAEYISYTRATKYIEFSSALPQDSIVAVSYFTNDVYSFSYNLGTGNTSPKYLGGFSFGNENAANNSYSVCMGSGLTVQSPASAAFGAFNYIAFSAPYAFASGIGNQVLGEVGYAEGLDNSSSDIASHAEGCKTSAEGLCSHTEGFYTTAKSYAHAGGKKSTAGAICTFAHGEDCNATGSYSVVFGKGCNDGSKYANMFVIGMYNSPTQNDYFEIGNGSSDAYRSNAFRVTKNSVAYVGSSTVSSDIRVKSDISDLNVNDAYEFVSNLKPKSYIKFERRELGFIAQDIEKLTYGDILVDESPNYGYNDFKNLSYDGLIAPLVATVQILQKENEELKQKNEELEQRLARLEAILLKDGDI